MLWFKVANLLISLVLCIYFFNDAKVQFENSNNRAGKIARAIGILSTISAVLNIIMIVLEFVA